MNQQFLKEIEMGSKNALVKKRSEEHTSELQSRE